ncbi:hypothetical protein OAP56_02775 [Rickettsiaceae bacterium]|nr:hypothetical protein [Rickettsiaceae bacterium]
MNIYSVYIDSSKKTSDPILITQGFSFIPVIFNIFWALYYRMWGVVIATIAVSTLSSMLYTNQLIDVTYPFTIAILCIFGFFGVEMREYYMIKRGFELDDVVFGLSEDEAEIKYLSRIQQVQNT